MTPGTQTRLAWAIALASVALWATSVPATFGSAAVGSLGTVAQRLIQTQSTDQTTANEDDVHVTTGDVTTAQQGAPCPPLTPAAAESAPPADATSPGPTVGPRSSSPTEAAFRLCGTADPAAERAIERLIAGRSFSSVLRSRSDGCADLTITIDPRSVPSAGRSSSNVSVSIGSGQALSVQVVSESGATRATITSTAANR